jgi:ABC-type transport system involved in multi-copper enzyme maturation permease subunit
MVVKTFGDLVRWELNEYLSLPMFAFIVVSAIFATLFQNSGVSVEGGYVLLFYGSNLVFFVMTLVAGAFFSRSFGGSVGKGEIKLLLSYPIKRWHIFLSKFVALFAVIFVVYCVAYSIDLYLFGLTLFEPMFYLTLFAFLLQLLLVCGVSISVSMITKNEVMSMMASLLLLLGINNLVGVDSGFSAQGRLRYLFQYFGRQIYGVLPFGDGLVITFGDVVMSIMVPLLVFAILLILSFVYFNYFMDVD